MTSESHHNHIFKKLYKDSNGTWLSQNDESSISYPGEARSLYFAIEDNSWWFKHRNNVIRQIIKRFLPKGLLDVGGGNGFVSNALEGLGIEYILVEPGYEGCLNALRRGLSNVICSSFERLQIEDHSIDSIGLFDVLEHIEDPVTLLKKVYRVLKKKDTGNLYITVPAHRWLWSDEDISAGHFTRYNISSLTSLVRKAGFEMTYSTYFFSYLSGLSFLLRALPYRIGLKMHKKSTVTGMEAVYSDMHKQKTGSLGYLMNCCFNRELRILADNKISHGSSIMAVCYPACNKTPKIRKN